MAKLLYFYDDDGMGRDDHARLVERLADYGIMEPVEATTAPPFYGATFDVLFFDWGGMSMGNSLLQDFCREIIKQAEDAPSKVFVMTSTFTGMAMRDATYELRNRPANIYLSIDRGIEAIAAVCGVSGVKRDRDWDDGDDLDW